MLLLIGGFGLLLLLVAWVNAAPGIYPIATVVPTSIQDAVVLSVLASNSDASNMCGVDIPPGRAAKSPWRPPGWDKGKKKGWEGDVPPGLE